ncbi:hypothetical protein [Prosthecobacter sp.]|uniref:hypothetical protein n=1 Tax=Prosthecobacter sp. TaxID=1965333 RepID=UPI002ABCC708|nr:hypothetical protein [Prosthecobacter sp.]MDZ4404893.1 hypothetical protein [Prosthecobacter sp.]
MDRRAFTINVASSIVASIVFVWLLEPTLKGIWHLLSISGTWIAAWLENRAFISAAKGKREWVSVLILSYILMGSVTVMFGRDLFLTLRRRIPKKALTEEEAKRKTRNHRLRSVFNHVAFLICVFIGIFIPFVDLQLTTSFYQRLDALAPYLEPQQEKMLRSQWALMKTRPDYENINHELDRLASKAGMNLPDLLYP